jgi:hypothetical protein
MMATLQEMVEEEATRAEAEPEDEDEDADAGERADESEEAEEAEEAEAEPEALAVIGEAEIRKAERARDAQRKRLAGILGEGYVSHECLFCSGLGFTPEPPPVGTSFLIVESEGGLAFAVTPPTPDIPLLQAPDKAMCLECDGYGEVLSGSKASHGLVTPCSKCMGNGWVMIPRDLPPPISGLPGPVVLPPGPVAVAISGGEDAWGRPAGHQHWGVPPAMISG